MVNQLAQLGHSIRIVFEGAPEGVWGYFDRLGFYRFLHPDIEVVPLPPITSASEVFAGSNVNVVEFQPICPDDRLSCKPIPGKLTDSLQNACQNRPDCESLCTAAYTVLGELIDNIFEHSSTVLNGYVALQVYARGSSAGNVRIAVSDSGAGLLDTLRSSLNLEDSMLSDSDLIIKMLNQGLSRFGTDRGCGICTSADHALKYKAALTIRLARTNLRIVPKGTGYDAVTFTMKELPLLKGTHFAFRFQLDSPP